MVRACAARNHVTSSVSGIDENRRLIITHMGTLPTRYAPFLLMCGVLSITLAGQGARPRASDLGIRPGILEPGPLNAITDVAGVKVGHATIVRGDRVRTGVTAVLPHGGNLFQEKVA